MNSGVAEFFKAVNANEVKRIVEIIKQKGIDVNVRDESNSNRTALHVAAMKGYHELFAVLIDKYDADYNVKDGNEETPLHIAINCYHMKIVKFLIQKNCSGAEDAKTVSNETNVEQFFEAVNNNATAEVEKILQTSKIDVNTIDLSNYKRTALHVAAANGNEELVIVLVVKFKADVNIEDEIGELPIHNAADNDHGNIVKFLASRNSNRIEDVEHHLK